MVSPQAAPGNHIGEYALLRVPFGVLVGDRGNHGEPRAPGGALAEIVKLAAAVELMRPNRQCKPKIERVTALACVRLFFSANR